MKKILHIIASPRGERSHSRHVSSYFIGKIQGMHPHLQVEELELNPATLPVFGKPGVFAKFKSGAGVPLAPDEREEWESAKAVWLRFQSADTYVFSIPMWNFAIPYELKHFIDLITQPGWTFGVSDKGYEGLLRGRKAFLSFAAGGNYDLPETAGFDFMRPYMRFWCGFNGMESFETTNHSTNQSIDHDAVLRECKAQVDDILLKNYKAE
jgi:FMN-dependent NADH-azoreductase